MTDHDSLRDRIEDTIEAAYAQWEFEFEAHEDGNRAYVDPGPKDAFIAQAIIDSLGLSSTTCCDVCTGVTIEGYYDTLFD